MSKYLKFKTEPSRRIFIGATLASCRLEGSTIRYIMPQKLIVEATITSISYYFQHEIPQQAATLAVEKLATNARDPILLFWHACAIGEDYSSRQ